MTWIVWPWTSFNETSSLCDKVRTGTWNEVVVSPLLSVLYGFLQYSTLTRTSPAEYEPYTKALGPGMVQQGDLTDPYYFDFISFAQYLAINREITQDPPMVFTEKQPIDVGEDQPQQFVDRVVRRDPSITNDRLASEHSLRVGATVLDRLDEIFRDSLATWAQRAPGSGRPSADQMLGYFSQLVKLFLINGFAWDGGASISSSSDVSTTEFTLVLVSPATIWGSQSLKFQRAELLNTYVCVKLMRESFPFSA